MKLGISVAKARDMVVYALAATFLLTAVVPAVAQVPVAPATGDQAAEPQAAPEGAPPANGGVSGESKAVVSNPYG